MNKKVLITAAVLIGIGIVGIVPSALSSIPYFTDMVVEAEKAVKKERELTKIAVISEEVQQLIITSEIADVRIVPSEKNNIEIYQTKPRYAEMTVTHSYNAKKKELEIIETGQHTSFFEEIRTDRIDKFIQDVLNRGFTDAYDAEIEIRVPKNVNIIVQSNGEDLYVNREVILKDVTFNTTYGNLEFIDRFNTRNLGTLQISSEGHTYIEAEDFQGFADIKINANDIHVDATTSNLSNGIIPKSIELSASNIEVNSNQALAELVTINGVNSSYGTIDIRLPMNHLDIDWDILTTRNPINFDGDISSFTGEEAKLRDDELFEYKGKIGRGTEMPSKIKIRANEQDVYISQYNYN